MDKVESLSFNNLKLNTSPTAIAEGNSPEIISYQGEADQPSSNNSSISSAKSGKWKPLSKNGILESFDFLCRQIKGNLNKLTIEKFETLAEKIAIQCESLSNYDELQKIVDIIIDKAVLEPEWSEMYSDLCQILYWRSLEFDVGSKKVSFASALLNKIQREYESVPKNFDFSTKKTLGTVKMIGELFQRKMIGFKIVNKVVFDLVMNQDPHEHLIECFIQLIHGTGYYIDQNPNLRPVLDMWFGRLKELMLRKEYSKRIKCLIQDVLNLPKAQWHKKVHRENAKSLNDLREKVNSEDILGGSALAAQFGNIVIVGQRYNLYSNCAYGLYMARQEELFKMRYKPLKGKGVGVVWELGSESAVGESRLYSWKFLKDAIEECEEVPGATAHEKKGKTGNEVADRNRNGRQVRPVKFASQEIIENNVTTRST
ncbi:eukaryotic initiation factor [Theileria orientalis strain Shintoku]|uniref:Eukaryotic initiation factor n=1 Tax=Theileria orientalis strain Shintoku TaxID=869250 RepID=J4C8S7_THEOR|nr:eukaryotic initiation factor [Theileria orientalis strain Shintoku]BAM41308.1 eukaryotic initiation factor [Theileria orientalis strain Shintoku]|eukprot:XP_009691609.1 eukaryotic initiation factor [Theileria orientalis strain Shintoku]